MNDRPREYDRELEEAVLLPEGDSTREEARRSIESQGEEGARRWAELLDEHERLRTALRATSIPPGLERRLLDIPRRRGPERPQVKRVWSAAAAATIVVALTAALLLFLPRSTDPDAAAERLAALATHDHLSQPELVVTTRDRAEFTAALGARAPFSVRIPAEMGGASLIGGRLCTFGESPIIYSRWRGSDGDAELSLSLHSGVRAVQADLARSTGGGDLEEARGVVAIPVVGTGVRWNMGEGLSLSGRASTDPEGGAQSHLDVLGEATISPLAGVLFSAGYRFMRSNLEVEGVETDLSREGVFARLEIRF